ncbi:MAG: hypothetical protein DRP86_06240 [Candidatus Neomarinimicrobiota bacterium]|nr:DUF1460 domain-containing protein [Candidatus Neomarinimicrobiota bacterium]RKY48653.1 MAG: hypothetical protein DRP86_06240 [Candidatus Neomarinimicrobiota bacterium]
MPHKKIIRVITLYILLTFPFISVQGGKIPENTAVISTLSHVQIDSMLQQNASGNATITDRIAYYSRLFLGMPYSWTATGDGEWALLENQPLYNLDSTNCMVYCEHVLALSISDSWDNFFNNLQQIRYQDGIMGMRTRNHYTMADWLPENRWLLSNVSRKVGGRNTRTLTRKISHKAFFRDKGIRDLRYIKPDRTLSVDYIPLKDLNTVEDRFQNGDILALLSANKDNIFSAHMLIMIKNEKGLFIREASNSQWTTFETPWKTWLEKIQKSPHYAGLAVMRVHAKLNKPGRIILPWEIHSMK